MAATALVKPEDLALSEQPANDNVVQLNAFASVKSQSLVVPVPMHGEVLSVQVGKDFGRIAYVIHMGNPGWSRQEIADYVNSVIPEARSSAASVAAEIYRFKKKHK